MTRNDIITAGFEAANADMDDDFVDLCEQVMNDKRAESGDARFVPEFVLGAEWALKQSPWIDTSKEYPKPLNKLIIDSGKRVIDIQPNGATEELPTYLCHKTSEDLCFVARSYESLQGLEWYGVYGNRICGIDDVDYYMPIPAIPKKGGEE